jgi:hypothetical protein
MKSSVVCISTYQTASTSYIFIADWIEFFHSFKMVWNLNRNSCAELGTSLLGCDGDIEWMLRCFKGHKVLTLSQRYSVTSTRLQSCNISVRALSLTIVSVHKWHIWRNNGTEQGVHVTGCAYSKTCETGHRTFCHHDVQVLHVYWSALINQYTSWTSC